MLIRIPSTRDRGVLGCSFMALLSLQLPEDPPQIPLKPENTDHRTKYQHQSGSVLQKHFKNPEPVTAPADQNQIRQKDETPDDDPGKGFGLLREEGSEDALVGSVFLVRVGIPCHFDPPLSYVFFISATAQKDITRLAKCIAKYIIVY